MNKKMKDILWGIFAVVLVVVCAVWMLGDDLEHIEDTNGPDDYSLTTITDENIINMDMGALTPVRISKPNVTIGTLDLDPIVDFSSEKFTGVYEIMYNNYLGSSDCVIRLTNLKVESGNFKMAVVHNDEIVAVVEPSDDPIEYWLDNISGTVALRIAGESASYSFSMFKTDYDDFAHYE